MGANSSASGADGGASHGSVSPTTNSFFRRAKTINLGSGIDVSFSSITYTVKNNSSSDGKPTVALLDGVSGFASAGECLALMGTSGSGKTTLMDVLCQRKTSGRTEGRVMFGGIEPTTQFLRRYCGYVEQFDTLVPILTVEEMFLYTAQLKLELNTPEEEKKAAVEDVIETLGLEQCRTVLIGSQMARGISGGQAKRVNIGIALISNPRVLFLDEPTTGLDSFTANEVIGAVAELALGGITVICTIHSPSSYSFTKFDRLMILESGKSVYFGATCQAIPYFKRTCSFLDTLDLHSSSDAEWLADCVVQAAREGYGKELISTYEASEEKAAMIQVLDRQMLETKAVPDDFRRMMQVKRATTTPTWFGIGILCRYRMLKNYSTLDFYASHVFPWLIQTLIIMSCFWFVANDVNAIGSVTNIAAILFFWTCTTAFGAATYVPNIVLSKPLYFRERNDGLYRSIAYLNYLFLEEVIIAVPTTLAINTIMWFALQLAGSFVCWWVSFFVAYVTGILVSYAICSVVPGGINGLNIANAAVPIYGVICLFFSGFLITINATGWWWRWLIYACPTFWAFSAQMNNFFAGDRNIPYLGSASVTDYFGVSLLGNGSPWPYVAMQCIFVVLFYLLAWAGLQFKQQVAR